MASSLKIPEPNAKQKKFFAAVRRYIGYGGARGGGKSWSVRVKSILLALNYPGIKVLIVRRSYPELEENHITPMQAMLKGIGAYKEQKKVFIFPNGSTIRFGYCRHKRDLLSYQGKEYDVIFLDEATQFDEEVFNTLDACLRGANSFPKRFYLTCNPGGVGHEWVKRLFITKDYRTNERGAEYEFIQALVYDNPALTQMDPGYIKMLESLPETQRRAWLDGDWDIFEGQYFAIWDRTKHVITPFQIPNDWRRYVALDYGTDMLACYWVAVDWSNKAYVYREVYQSGLLASQAAEIIKANCHEAVFSYLAPPDLWNKHSDTGRSTADIFAEWGVPLMKVSNNRVQGWADLAEWLAPRKDEQGQYTPSLQIFETCTNLTRTLPALQRDSKNNQDVATEPHELTHAPDAIRYFVAGRPFGERQDIEQGDTLTYDQQVSEFLKYGK